ncbi:MAG TPA: hypothetical protein VG167_08815 [Verrucomicrobiae bacterium]|nr:hypothetical protein [Verrucomicrobiae bacterium]
MGAKAAGSGERIPSPAEPRAERFWNPARRRLLRVVFGVKAAMLFVVLCAVTFFPSFNLREYQNDIHWPRQGPPTLATYFATWDAAHYLLLSETGYEGGTASCAFYPLWPYLMRAFSYLTFRDHFAAGLLLANLLSVAILLVFHYFVTLYHGADAANASVALLLAYPGALYFSFIYTESLFLLLALLFFLFLFQGRYLWAAIAGFFLPLTKAVGLFCVFPLIYQLWLRRAAWRPYLAYYGPVLGYACYFGIMYCATGNAFEGFQAQGFFPNRPSIGHIFDVPAFLRELFRPLQLHGMLNSAIDRGLFLILLGSLYPIYRLNRVYLPYALFIGVVPALSSWFLSYTRNVMMCFPLFILFGVMLSGRQRRFALVYVLLVMGTIQVWFLLRHVNFIWVA